MHPYASKDYAACFQEQMEPLWLPQMGCHVLLRAIEGSEQRDAMGPYPMCPIIQQSSYEEDFALLRDAGAVSLVMVGDTFSFPKQEALAPHFDVCTPFKAHFIHDLHAPEEERAFSKHHRYEVRKSLRSCETRLIELPDYLDEWCVMYDNLVEKHAISGVQAFSRSYFERLCNVGPQVTVAAFVDDRMISAHIWLEHEGYVYSHLAASTDEGYQLGAAYPIYAHTIEHYKEKGAKALDFGGGAGASGGSAGLARFKKGFATGEVTNLLVGKIVDAECYAALSEGKGESGFFPAYRG